MSIDQHTPEPVTADAPVERPRRSIWVTIGLIATAIAIAIGGFFLAAPAPEGEAAFAGADGAAEDVVTEVAPDYEPWFEPIFDVGSTEVESGLFAAQAGIGGGIVGYALGRYRRRSGE